MTLKTEFVQQGNFLFRHRSYLPLIILVIGVYLYITKDMSFTGENRMALIGYELFCLAVCLLGLFIRIITLGYVAPRTSGRNTTEGQIADSVNTHGMYSLCRHPLYLGNFFMWLGIALLTQNLWFVVAFIFLYWVYYERIMFAEEAFLTSKFGDAYVEYAKNVPAFIPRFSNFRKPGSSFNMRKIIRQEKTGLLNVFLVIMIMKATQAIITMNMDLLEVHWIIGFVASFILYITVKIIQKRTLLLADA